MEDTLLEDLLINSRDELQTEIAVANDLALHPYHQQVQDHPQDYVTIHKNIWNRIVTLAAQAYLAQQSQPAETWYQCRYPGCKQQYRNSPSNRTRHEKQAHGYTHKENSHGVD